MHSVNNVLTLRNSIIAVRLSNWNIKTAGNKDMQ